MYVFFPNRLQTPIGREERSQRRGQVSPARRVRPCLETLEDRVVPSGSNLAMDNSIAAGARFNTAEHLSSSSGVSKLQVQSAFSTQHVAAGTTDSKATSSDVSKIPLAGAIPTPASGPQGATGQVSNAALTSGNRGAPSMLHFSVGINGAKDGQSGSIQAASISSPQTAHPLDANEDDNDDHNNSSNTSSSVTSSSTSSSSTTPTPIDALAQQAITFYQAFDSVVLSLESSLTAINPVLADLLLSLDASLDMLALDVLSQL